MINAFINGIMSFVITLVNIILSPIDNLIAEHLPTLDNAFNSISALFNLVADFVGWTINLFALPDWLLSFIISYYVFKLTIPLIVSVVKTAISWYNALKP